ncbi:hypothetical protein [Achromobacter phage Motura]|uniref:SWIM-type domain-containing protein n=1 Tax=Achromobacter phage Motura TaxID=2591403 RepID=A0A514CSJ7_9CAUD|nr:hypothetical protein H1O15_gp032 [Achromobacter phage Motura]QDH83440.1 hypothetical protein [Achromobacter phage Motura]
MLTFPQIIKRTTKDRIASAKYVKILKTKSGYDQLGRGYIAAQTMSTHEFDYSTGKWYPAKNKPMYLTKAVFFDNKLHCLVSCSCPDFPYRWEYALTAKDASEIEYSDGSAPNITNPTLRPGACKHLVRLYLRIQNKLKK